MIVNLTQHDATPEQIAQGVVDLVGYSRDSLVKALTFTEIPDRNEIGVRAAWIAELAVTGYIPEETLDAHEEQFGLTKPQAMIGGAPFLMAALETALKEVGIQPIYAFSVRESVEEPQADGSVRKSTVFRHGGFVEA